MSEEIPWRNFVRPYFIPTPPLFSLSTVIYYINAGVERTSLKELASQLATFERHDDE